MAGSARHRRSVNPSERCDGADWQIKRDGRLVDLAPTDTDLARLMPMPYLKATLANKGKHRIFPDGNVYTLDGKPWIGGNPFSQPQSAAEILWANTLSWGKHDSQAHPVLDFDTDADGNVQCQYASLSRILRKVRPVRLSILALATVFGFKRII